MAANVLMPALSPTMEQGKLAKWIKKEGDAVKSGDVLAEIETDKATMEVEAVDEGILAKILVPDGTDNVAVNTPIAVITAEGESADAAPAAAPAPKQAEPAAAGGEKPASDAKSEDDAPVAPAKASGQPATPSAPRSAGRNADGVDDGSRSAARCDGRRDAGQRERLRDGRRGRRISGRLQGHAGIAAGIRRAPRRRYADHRTRLRRHGRRRRNGGPAPHRRIHDLQFRHAGDRPDHQFGRQDALYVGRADGLSDRVPRSQRRSRARRCATQPGLYRLVLADSGPEGRRALYGGGFQGSFEIGHPRSEPDHLPRERDPLRSDVRGSEARRFHGSDRQGSHRPVGIGRDHRLLVDRHDLRHQGGGRTRQGRHRGGDHRSAARSVLWTPKR